jgi:hypothetical protein
MPRFQGRPGTLAMVLALPLAIGSQLTACDPAPVAPISEPLIFVRGGVLAPAGTPGQALPDGHVLVERPWRPGESVVVGAAQATAPARAECVPLFHQDLGDVQRLIAMGGEAPNTSMAWSPDAGSRLAVGSYTGEVLVLDGWTGEVIARRGFAETMVKHVAWSADGATLYAAEQSPDANVYALDPTTLAPRWTLRLADLVETSAAPSGEDVYGVYKLPAAYGMEVMANGSLLIAALHSWPDSEGARHNASQLLVVSPNGEIQARWPETPADATLKHPRVFGDRVAVVVGRSADGPAPTDLPIGGIQILSLPNLTPIQSVTTPALEPWFKTANVWEALDLDAEHLLMGFGDGRLRIVNRAGEDRLSLTTGAPVMAGEVPILAGIGWGLLRNGQAVFNTSGTQIPYGALSENMRPPTQHPNENGLWIVNLDGEPAWSWTGPYNIVGLSMGADARHLVVGAGARSADTRRDLYGALIFDMDGPDRGGEDRLEAICPTQGPVFFRQALSADGRLALSENPWREEDGAVSGTYRVTVLR